MSPDIPSIIFIGGVHGVGKTTFSQKISKVLMLPAYSAGHLIRNHKGRASSGDKNVANVSDNQDALVEAVRLLKMHGKTIILDGHFCVRDKVSVITRIPLSTYEALQIKLILILEEEAVIIQERLQARDDTYQDCQDIDLLQNAEVEYGKEVAMTMRIPIQVCRNTQIDEAFAFIRANLQTGHEV